VDSAELLEEDIYEAGAGLSFPGCSCCRWGPKLLDEILIEQAGLNLIVMDGTS
jgi:hypothetical protein